MDHNQFQRELVNRNIGKQEAYLFSLIYERLSDLSQQVDMCAKLIDQLTSSLAGFVSLNENIMRDIGQLKRRGMPDGIDVHSVVNDPDED